MCLDQSTYTWLTFSVFGVELESPIIIAIVMAGLSAAQLPEN